MSKSRTVERKEARTKQRQRQRQITTIVIVAVVAVIALVFAVLVNMPAEAPIPAEAAARYADLPQSQTSEQFHMLGNAEAPVEVIEYSSFDCTHCRDFHETVLPSLLQRVKAGEVKFTYVPLYNFGSVANGQGAAQAALCVGLQGKFWEMHDALFAWQGAYVNQAFTENRIRTGLDNLGINRDQWNQCMSNGYAQGVLDAAASAARLQGISGTPTIIVNGTAVSAPDWTTINQAIDVALGIAPEATPEITPEATVPA